MAPSYGLAIHTSSPDLGLAISNFTDDPRNQVWSLGREVSNQLHHCLATFLAPQVWSDLMFVAVAQGPGGYTGTRLGVVTARTLAQQLNIPLFPISSLAAIAYQHSQHFTQSTQPMDIAVRMQAQRGAIYGGIYRITSEGFEVVQSDQVLSEASWQTVLDSWTTPYHLVLAQEGSGRSVTALLQLAYADWKFGKRPHWSEALPFYGQHPVTEA